MFFLVCGLIIEKNADQFVRNISTMFSVLGSSVTDMGGSIRIGRMSMGKEGQVTQN